MTDQKQRERRVVPAPITVGDVHRVLEMIDESPTNAKAKVTVHELRGVADVLREWLGSKGEVPRTEPATPNGSTAYKEVIAKLEADKEELGFGLNVILDLIDEGADGALSAEMSEKVREARTLLSRMG